MKIEVSFIQPSERASRQLKIMPSAKFRTREDIWGDIDIKMNLWKLINLACIKHIQGEKNRRSDISTRRNRSQEKRLGGSQNGKSFHRDYSVMALSAVTLPVSVISAYRMKAKFFRKLADLSFYTCHLPSFHQHSFFQVYICLLLPPPLVQP